MIEDESVMKSSKSSRSERAGSKRVARLQSSTGAPGRRLGVPSYGYGIAVSHCRSPVAAQRGERRARPPGGGPSEPRVFREHNVSSIGADPWAEFSAPLAREARSRSEIGQPPKSSQTRPNR